MLKKPEESRSGVAKGSQQPFNYGFTLCALALNPSGFFNVVVRQIEEYEKEQ